jgi:magnesium-transporting ATPase (P-type)
MSIVLAQLPPKTIVSDNGQSALWTRWHSFGLFFIVAVMAALGVATPSLSLSRLACWLIILALFLLFFVVVGHGFTGRPQGLLIDDRNKMSLSRLQMVMWTTLILSGLLTVALTNIGQRAAAPLMIAVPGELWLLMGISTTSLVGSPLLKSTKMGNGQIDTRDHLDEAEVADLFRGEENSNAGVLDLAKVQMFFFTLVLALAYAAILGSLFAHTTSAITNLPELDQSMVALLGISHAGYLANKAVPHPDAPQMPEPPQPAG